VVYRATHVTRGTPAAVKLVGPREPADIQRWFADALAASAIRYPGIAEVYEVGTLGDGTAFVAMELATGESLATRMQRRLTWTEIVTIVRSACTALDTARAYRLVHGSLKPTNLFVAHDLEMRGERVKLVDFGTMHLQRENNRVPTYLAPEQCRYAKVDHRSDIYALGCMFYEMVVGHPPFVGSPGDVFAGHLFERHQPLATLVENRPHGLAKLVERMLAKNPHTRPQSTAEIIDMLDGLTLQPTLPQIVEPVEMDGLESDSVVIEAQYGIERR